MSPTQLADPERHWQAEYEFFHKIITDEVERLRFNDGLEPIDFDLYPVARTAFNRKTDYVARLRIARRHFNAIAFHSTDKDGNKILRVQLRAEE